MKTNRIVYPGAVRGTDQPVGTGIGIDLRADPNLMGKDFSGVVSPFLAGQAMAMFWPEWPLIVTRVGLRTGRVYKCEIHGPRVLVADEVSAWSIRREAFTSPAVLTVPGIADSGANQTLNDAHYLVDVLDFHSEVDAASCRQYMPAWILGAYYSRNQVGVTSVEIGMPTIGCRAIRVSAHNASTLYSVDVLLTSQPSSQWQYTQGLAGPSGGYVVTLALQPGATRRILLTADRASQNPADADFLEGLCVGGAFTGVKLQATQLLCDVAVSGLFDV